MKKFLSESLLIVFSVLFALMINSMFEQRQVNKKKKIAIESINKELDINKVILDRWSEKHRKMQNRLSDVAFGSNDSLKTKLKEYQFLHLGVLFENSNLIDEMVQSTAWETAKSTDILNEFNFETIQHLSNFYKMQDVITNKTILSIIEQYYDKESLDLENLDKTLIQFAMMMGELVGQENIMPTYYDLAKQSLAEE